MQNIWLLANGIQTYNKIAEKP